MKNIALALALVLASSSLVVGLAPTAANAGARKICKQGLMHSSGQRPSTRLYVSLSTPRRDGKLFPQETITAVQEGAQEVREAAHEATR